MRLINFCLSWRLRLKYCVATLVPKSRSIIQLHHAMNLAYWIANLHAKTDWWMGVKGFVCTHSSKSVVHNDEFYVKIFYENLSHGFHSHEHEKQQCLSMKKLQYSLLIMYDYRLWIGITDATRNAYLFHFFSLRSLIGSSKWLQLPKVNMWLNTSFCTSC